MSAAAVLYLDSSALVKLVLEEDESDALRHFLGEWPLRASSIVARVEVHRAARRESEGAAAASAKASEVLEVVNLMELDDEVIQTATNLEPLSLRTLDAVHLASALSLVGDLGTFVTYDTRQQQAATAAGINVAAPA